MRWIVLLIAISGVVGLFDSTNIIKPIKSIKTMERVLYDVDLVSILLFYNDDCEKCE
jgi:hypothetical protein